MKIEYKDAFQDWIKQYFPHKQNIIKQDEKNNRLYRIGDDAILVLLTMRDKLLSDGEFSLIASTQSSKKTGNGEQDTLKHAISEAQKNKLKFFCCAIYGKKDTNPLNSNDPDKPQYPEMQNYFLSVESFNYFLDPGSGTITITEYYDIIANQKPNFLRVHHENKQKKKVYISFIEKSFFENYLDLFDNRPYLNIGGETIVEIEKIKEIMEIDSIFEKIDYPQNLLIHGAPGTGKSHFINGILKEKTKSSEQYERVTFFEDYSYGSFVGTYKPVMSDINKDISITMQNEEYNGSVNGPQVVYEFVPGPFSKILLKSYLELIRIAENPSKDAECTAKNYFLIIEEINRAKAASVFGDMFQLLDRTSEGYSEYEITPSEEFLAWYNGELQKEFPNYPEVRTIGLPRNMYIWASMNSADQGVFPLDTAFKRRWGYIYKGVNTLSGLKIKLVHVISSELKAADYDWDKFRKLINQSIVKYFDEDRCIGPYYFSWRELEDISTFSEAVVRKINGTPSDEPSKKTDDSVEIGDMLNPLVDKLFSYLRHDVFRNNPKTFFNDNFIHMSQIRTALEGGTELTNIIKNLNVEELEQCLWQPEH